jgi:hypothetical protein
MAAIQFFKASHRLAVALVQAVLVVFSQVMQADQVAVVYLVAQVAQQAHQVKEMQVVQAKAQHQHSVAVVAVVQVRSVVTDQEQTAATAETV